MPRWVDCKRATFKYGLGDEFIDVLKVLHTLGLDRTEKVRVKGVEVSPRDVVAAVLPDPATLGPRMKGKTCAGLWVTGKGKDGEPRSTYLYHVVDNEWSMAEYGHQCVVWQTAINPVVALELLATGLWRGAGRARPRGLRRRAVPRPADRVRQPVGPDGGRSVRPSAHADPRTERVPDQHQTTRPTGVVGVLDTVDDGRGRGARADPARLPQAGTGDRGRDRAGARPGRDREAAARDVLGVARQLRARHPVAVAQQQQEVGVAGRDHGPGRGVHL